MTWAEYLAWWQDPINLLRTFEHACFFGLGCWTGYRHGRRDEKKAMMLLWAKCYRLGQLAAATKPESEK